MSFKEKEIGEVPLYYETQKNGTWMKIEGFKSF